MHGQNYWDGSLEKLGQNKSIGFGDNQSEFIGDYHVYGNIVSNLS